VRGRQCMAQAGAEVVVEGRRTLVGRLVPKKGPIELRRSAIALESSQTWTRERTASLEPSTRVERFMERHYTLSEIAAMWNLSHDFVRRLFQSEPGVLIMGREEPTSSRRRYAIYRIPESVVERIHRRLSRIG
jgi:hypothetical protein